MSEAEQALGAEEQVRSPTSAFEQELASGVALAALFRAAANASGATDLDQAIGAVTMLAAVLSKRTSKEFKSKVLRVAEEMKKYMPGLAVSFDFQGAGETLSVILNINPRQDDGMRVMTINGQAPFEVGKVMISPGVQEYTTPSFVLETMSKYLMRDWGNLLTDGEKETNSANAEKSLGTIFAIYPIDKDKEDGPNNQIYIVTSEDRKETKICLPAEY